MDNQPGLHCSVNADQGTVCLFWALALSDHIGCYSEVLAMAQVSAPRLFHFPDNRHMGFFKCKNVTVYTYQL